MTTGHTSDLGLGLIGCGSIAYWQHLGAVAGLRHAALVAAADPDEGARDRAGAIAPIPVHADADELLARNDVDAVIVAVPTHLHADLAVRAAAAGKHVYLEKPLATSVRDGLRVADAARRASVSVMLGFNRRFHPLYEQARAFLRGGSIGAIRSVQSTFTEPATAESMPPWKRDRETGGGVLLDLASHHFDLVRWLLGDEATRVSAILESAQTDQDGASVQIALRGGATAQSFFSCRAAVSDAFEFLGEDGRLRVDRHGWGLSLTRPRRFGYGTRSSWVGPSSAVVALGIKRLLRPSADPSYGNALQTFVDNLRGAAREVPGIEDGLRAMELVEAAEHAARRGETVELQAGESSRRATAAS